MWRWWSFFFAICLVVGDPIGFGSIHPGQVIGGAGISPPFTSASVDDCAASCLSQATNPVCIAFNWYDATKQCQLNTWSHTYAVNTDASGSYYFKILAKNQSRITPAISLRVNVPTSGIQLLPGGLFASTFTTNIKYLSQYPVDDMLYWYRLRAGQTNPPGQNWGWDNADFEGGYGLHGSVSGLFMMGAGGTLRWQNDTDLWNKLSQVVDGIAELQEDDGYLMAFKKNETNYHENPDYVTSWVTHGLLEASIAGFQKALTMLRGHFDWFNYAGDILAQFLPPDGGPGDGSWPFPPSSPQTDHGHQIYLIKQGIIHNTRLALSSVGNQGDVDLVQNLYQEDWWLTQLIARNLSAIWLRHWYPHNYEITAFEAYFDMYFLTGNETYLHAVEGAWELLRDHWIHVGGSIALNELNLYPPDSYYLDNNLPTGELCGSSFWSRLNQRFHRLRPTEEVYITEIERSIINVAIANQDPSGFGIRYFADLDNYKNTPTNVATCCESQGTRTFGSLPEFLYSTSTDQNSIFLNIYQGSVFTTQVAGQEGKTQLVLKQTTNFPFDSKVDIVLSVPDLPRLTFSLFLRIPSWISSSNLTMQVTNNGQTSNVTGTAGSFLEIRRSWASGDEVSFVLPMALRSAYYNGSTQYGCYRRYAVLYGPVLLAATGPWTSCDGKDCLFVNVTQPDQPDSFLVPVDGTPLRWSVKNQPQVVYQPYFQIQQERFTVYPAFSGGIRTCDIIAENYPEETASICLNCPNGVIKSLEFASFGTVTGDCTAGFTLGSCNAANTTSVVSGLCVGKANCTVAASINLFGDPCQGTPKRLAALITCSAA